MWYQCTLCRVVCQSMSAMTVHEKKHAKESPEGTKSLKRSIWVEVRFEVDNTNEERTGRKQLISFSEPQQNDLEETSETESESLTASLSMPTLVAVKQDGDLEEKPKTKQRKVQQKSRTDVDIKQEARRVRTRGAAKRIDEEQHEDSFLEEEEEGEEEEEEEQFIDMSNVKNEIREVVEIGLELSPEEEAVIAAAAAVESETKPDLDEIYQDPNDADWEEKEVKKKKPRAKTKKPRSTGPIKLMKPSIQLVPPPPSDFTEPVEITITKTGRIITNKKQMKKDVQYSSSVGYKVCSICGFIGRNVTDVEEHWRSHTNEKPFKCPVCPNRFSRTQNMRHHIRFSCAEAKKLGLADTFNKKAEEFAQKYKQPIDRSLLAHKCPHCIEAFKDAQKLSCHVRVHSLGKNGETHKCDFCGGGFYSSRSVIDHMSRVHNEHVGKFCCSLCEKRLSTRSSLNRHLLLSHGKREPSSRPTKAATAVTNPDSEDNYFQMKEKETKKKKDEATEGIRLKIKQEPESSAAKENRLKRRRSPTPPLPPSPPPPMLVAVDQLSSPPATRRSKRTAPDKSRASQRSGGNNYTLLELDAATVMSKHLPEGNEECGDYLEVEEEIEIDSQGASGQPRDPLALE